MKIQNFYLSRIILLINVGVFGYMLFKYGTTTSPEALIDTLSLLQFICYLVLLET